MMLKWELAPPSKDAGRPIESAFLVFRLTERGSRGELAPERLELAPGRFQNILSSVSLSPKGWNSSAQGNAPGNALGLGHRFPLALKGRHWVESALSGLKTLLGDEFPRALPWADEWLHLRCDESTSPKDLHPAADFGFRTSSFGFDSDFGFRASDLLRTPDFGFR